MGRPTHPKGPRMRSLSTAATPPSVRATQPTLGEKTPPGHPKAAAWTGRGTPTATEQRTPPRRTSPRNRAPDGSSPVRVEYIEQLYESPHRISAIDPGRGQRTTPTTSRRGDPFFPVLDTSRMRSASTTQRRSPIRPSPSQQGRPGHRTPLRGRRDSGGSEVTRGFKALTVASPQDTAGPLPAAPGPSPVERPRPLVAFTLHPGRGVGQGPRPPIAPRVDRGGVTHRSPGRQDKKKSGPADTGPSTSAPPGVPVGPPLAAHAMPGVPVGPPQADRPPGNNRPPAAEDRSADDPGAAEGEELDYEATSSDSDSPAFTPVGEPSPQRQTKKKK